MAGLYQDPVTVSGSLVTFNDTDGDGRITNLSAAISPIQDLNGYDHPWPAGGGKNIADVRADNSSNSQRMSITGTPGNLTFTSTGVYGRAGYTIPVVTGQTYTISFKASKTVSSDANSALYVNDTAGNWGYSYGAVTISRAVSGEQEYTKTITATSDTLFLGFYISVGASYPDTVIVKDLQVELGSSKTSYAPYSNICPITGHDTVNVYVSPTTDIEDATVYTKQLGQTVYGGTVDLVTGVLTVDRAMAEIKNAYRDGTYNATTGLGTFWYTSGISTLNSLNDGVVCNRMITISNVTPTTPNGYITWSENGIIRWTEKRDMSVEDYNAWLNDNPLQVTYKLPTPLTYQLSAQTIQTLLGTNNIWADAGDVTVTYQLARHGFEGWLIKFGEGDGSEQLPWYLIEGKSLKVTPQQRMEWSAERDVNGNLHRETTDNMPTKIEFNIPPCTSNEMSDFTSMLRRHYTDAKQRKLHVQYYDPARDSFGEGSFYVPDIQFPVSMVDLEHNLITYDATRVAFIEY